MTLFRLDASIAGTNSVSRKVADVVEDTWASTHGAQTVARRDLAADPVPTDAWQIALAAGAIAPDERSAAQRTAADLASTLADEVLAADAYVFAIPLFNFGVSQHVKAWIDLLLTDPRFAPGTPSPVAGRPLALVITRGGGYAPGTPRHGWDHATPYYQRIFGEHLGMDVHLTEVELTLAASNPAMSSLVGLADESMAAGLETAAAHGRHLTQRVRPLVTTTQEA